MSGASIIASAWCVVHLGFFLSQRGTGLLRSERRIFLFHLASFAGLVATMIALPSDRPWIAVMSAISLHGIYSLTFLEFWSLAEGGYTILLLQALSIGAVDSDRLVRELAAIGDRKRETRIDALTRLRLISIEKDGVVGLTGFGLIATRLLGALRWLCIRGATG
jgi:hypothetical protein